MRDGALRWDDSKMRVGGGWKPTSVRGFMHACGVAELASAGAPQSGADRNERAVCLGK